MCGGILKINPQHACRQRLRTCNPRAANCDLYVCVFVLMLLLRGRKQKPAHRGRFRRPHDDAENSNSWWWCACLCFQRKRERKRRDTPEKRGAIFQDSADFLRRSALFVVFGFFLFARSKDRLFASRSSSAASRRRSDRWPRCHVGRKRSSEIGFFF